MSCSTIFHFLRTGPYVASKVAGGHQELQNLRDSAVFPQRDRIKEAISTLQGRSKVRRVMWSRRAQEYESKINSGDPVSIAEVVRDLHRGSDQPEQSYSERQIYQAALERLARELAAVEKIDQVKATQKLENVLLREERAEESSPNEG